MSSYLSLPTETRPSGSATHDAAAEVEVVWTSTSNDQPGLLPFSSSSLSSVNAVNSGTLFGVSNDAGDPRPLDLDRAGFPHSSSSAHAGESKSLDGESIPPPAEEIVAVEDYDESGRGRDHGHGLNGSRERQFLFGLGRVDYLRSFVSLPKSPASIANLLALLLLALGLMFTWLLPESNNPSANKFARFLRTIGLFSLTLGLLNAVSVMMLFERSRFIIRSGVFRREYRSVRTAMRSAVLSEIIDAQTLGEFTKQHSQSFFMDRIQLDSKLRRFLALHSTNDAIERQVSLHTSKSGLDRQKMITTTQKLLGHASNSLSVMILSSFEADGVLSPQVLWELCASMVAGRIEELTPGKVKEIMEDLIRRHLGWVILWGNVVGALIGLVVELNSIH